MDHDTAASLGISAQESSLLLTLEEISQVISHSHNPHETLENIVRLIQRRFLTDVSSVYLFEPETEDLVLAATVGLDPSGVGRVRMQLSEGLTGLVAEQMSPVMEPDAPLHPRFKYFPEVGEDPYHSFLGVPLIESGALQGVLVVQTVDRRSFSANEIRMLVTVGSQLAPVVSGAQLLERVAAAKAPGSAAGPSSLARPPRRFEGTPLSGGVGLGRAYLIGQLAEPLDPDDRADDVQVEIDRLHRAMEAARDEIARLSRRISHLVGEDHGAILQAQLMILQDSTVERDLAACLALGVTAESALRRTLEKYVATFQKITNPFFQERIFDIKDVFRRVLWHLRPEELSMTLGEERLILVAQEASVLDLFSVDLDHLVGVVVEQGGPQSHAVIIARSLHIPMIGQVGGLMAQIESGQLLRIDGGNGTIELDPSLETNPAEASFGTLDLDATIGDGPTCESWSERPGMPRIEANVNLLSEAGQVLACGASGVGLYRSEMLFLARRTLPTEEEQVEIYRKLIDALEGRPVTIRTFDLRPDKLAHGATVASSLAQSLDWRLVLESPILQRLFKDQVRAILRAAAVGPVRLLIPLVTRSRLLEFAIETVNQARLELMREGLPFGRDVPLGIMIEVPAVAPLIGDWASRVDFFSLGTNDLIAAALGVNRDDPVGTLSDDIFHPGLIRMIGGIIASAREAGRTVCVCGEMASDPSGAVIMSALGADTLSLAVDRVGTIRSRLERLDPETLPALGSRLLEADTVERVKSLLQESVPAREDVSWTHDPAYARKRPATRLNVG